MEINNVQAVRADINEAISRIRDLANKSKSIGENEAIKSSNSFEQIMSAAKNSLGSVNQAQMETESLKTSYLAGDSHVSMSEVILSSQKSKLAFEGLLTVRNKILEAYKEIMNMPI